MKTNCIYKFIFFLYMAIASCNVKKDEDYVITYTEAQSINKKLKTAKVPLTKYALEDIINSSSVDGEIRWEVSTNSRFLIKSKRMHPLRAGSAEKRFWYIDHKFSILRL